MKTITSLALSIMLSAIAIGGETEEVKVPANVQPFIEKNSKPIALEAADLNGDGREDYILVLERGEPKIDNDGFPINQRPLLILIRGKNNKLTKAKRNEKIVYCSECGGSMGDPFQGVEAGRNTFTVKHYGGSGQRWSARYVFNYVAAKKTWRLVRTERDSFSANDPEHGDQTIKRPDDFGEIDIVNFDPKVLDERPE